MAPIKKKEVSKSLKKEWFKKPLTILSFSIGIICILVFSLYIYKYINTISPPVFEEIYSVKSELSNKIQKIDYSIYESLYLNGIKEKDIQFSNVDPRHEKDQEWDFTAISIKLQNEDSISQLGGIIDKDLSRLEPAIIHTCEEPSSVEKVYHIYVDGIYTHKIILKIEKEEKPIDKTLPRLAIIIDDLGYNRSMADTLIFFDLPLSLSILPMAPYTEYVAKLARENDREILLHLPMEPKNYPDIDPGPGALFVEMTEEDIRERMCDLLVRVDGISGVNNHMGSRFTENDKKMAIVLQEIKNRDLFYIDSRTSNKTVAFKLAKEIGVPATKKNVFLDHDLSSKAIKFQMERLLSIARNSGTAVGIGHPHKETISILEEYKEILQNEFKVVPVSQLVS